ncbi:MAG: CopD family protein [Oceanicoccus sp.]
MLWIKALHIIAVICWFAGIFYLPRIFVNHAMAEHKETRKQLAQMAHKLYRFMSIFPFATIIFGFWLTSYNWSYYWSSGWFIVKVVLVGFLIVYHLICGKYVAQINQDNNQHQHVYYRWFNEIPVLMLFAIVILVVIKPFS